MLHLFQKETVQIQIMVQQTNMEMVVQDILLSQVGVMVMMMLISYLRICVVHVVVVQESQQMMAL